MISSDIQPIQNLRVLQYIGAEKKAEWGKHWIETGFNGGSLYCKEDIVIYCLSFLEAVTFFYYYFANCLQIVDFCCVLCAGLEAYLQTSAGKYCVGDEVCYLL